MKTLNTNMAAKYFGAKVLLPSRVITHILSIHENGNIQVAHSTGNQDIWNVSDLKLLLTSISDISNKDAIEVAKIYCPLFDFSGVIKSEVFQSKRIFHKTGSICLMPDLSGSIYDFDGINICDLNYFRTKFYDCDNLIVDGIAVDEKTL